MYILGGKDWDILKFYACEASSSHAYQRFMQLIGKMCKKSELHGEANYVSHYFSDAAGYTAEDGAFRPWEDAAHFTAELLSAAQAIRSHTLSREENHA